MSWCLFFGSNINVTERFENMNNCFILKIALILRDTWCFKVFLLNKCSLFFFNSSSKDIRHTCQPKIAIIRLCCLMGGELKLVMLELELVLELERELELELEKLLELV